jgi:hypothetical protein
MLQFGGKEKIAVCAAKAMQIKPVRKNLLLVSKSKNTGQVKAVLMHVVSKNSTGEEVSYKPMNSHFSGFIFFTSLEGNYINGWQYENGTIVRRRKGESTAATGGRRGRMYNL